MKKLIIAIVLFAGFIQLNAQNSLQNKVDSLPFPRLWKMNWYSPDNYRSKYYDYMGIDIGSDANKTALINSLRIYDMLVCSGLTTPAIANKYLSLKESLNPNMIIFDQVDIGGHDLKGMDTSQNVMFPYRPQWFSFVVGDTLADTTHIGDSLITVLPGHGGKFFFCSDTVYNRNWNDNIFIEDINPDSSEMLLIKGKLGNKLYMHPNANPNHGYSYDFSQIKHTHLPGTKVWIVHFPEWSSFWGWNMSNLCPKIKVDNDSIRFNKYHPKKVWQQFNQCKTSNNIQVADGIWIDTFNDYYYGKYSTFDKVWPYADFNFDGIPDFQDGTLYSPLGNTDAYIQWANKQWADGKMEYARNLRILADSLSVYGNIPIVQNSGRNTQQYVNGVHFERMADLVEAPDITGLPFEKLLVIYDSMMNCNSCPQPRICQMQGINYDTLNIHYHLFRRDLTFSLMNNGFFYYTSNDMYYGYPLWWFDEYTVDSTGSSITLTNGDPVDIVDPTQMDEALFQKLKKAKGYLGFPLGGYQRLSGGVLRRDFDHGVIFCNTSSNNVDVSISLADTLKRIKGKQDTVVNNGASVIGSFILPRNDGIILLRKNKLTGIESESNLPTKFILYQNYPNPFNPSTKIKYSIPNSAKVLIKVYDVLGKEVTTLMNEFQNTGTHEIEFDVSKLSSGLYFYRIISGIYSETRKMILLR